MNFTLAEFLHSNTAERTGGAVLSEQQNPPAEIISAIDYQIQKLWQPCRTALGASFTINSGYRCKALNKITPGSSDTSQHTLGEAADVRMSESFFKQVEFVKTLNAAIEAVTGKYVRKDVNASYYLFAYIALNMEALDVDQLIHDWKILTNDCCLDTSVLQ
jgi:hypothetical protein